MAAVFPLFFSMLSDSGEEVGGILKVIVGMAAVLPFSDPVVSASVLLIGIWLLKTVVTLLQEWLSAYASSRVLYEARVRVADRYAGAHYQFFLDSQQGALIYNTLLAPSGVASVLHAVVRMVTELLKIIAIVILLLSVSPFITLALVILGLAYFGVISYVSRRVSYRLGAGLTRAQTEQTIIVNELFSGILQVITFGTAKAWLDRFQGANRTYSELYVKNLLWLGIPVRVMEFTTIGLMLGIILTLRFLSPDTFSTILATLGVFAMGLIRLLPAITTFGRTRMEVMAVFPDVERAYSALTGPVPMRRGGGRALQSFERAMLFENVSFAHKGRDVLLKGVNLAFEKGKVTAIVGPSGAGKTTIIQLILGLFEPTKGRITIDGIPLQEYRLDSWLSKIGFVSQNTFIFHSTIADNIMFSRDGHSIESVIKAAKVANAHGFISELPQGYDTIVGERGAKLSGGQQQRIAIARAVLDNPEILIFDEATSSLDTISEELVKEAINNVSKDRTVIIIAHRISTISHADKIVVVDQGRVVEEGSHQELLSKPGCYSRLLGVGTS